MAAKYHRRSGLIVGFMLIIWAAGPCNGQAQSPPASRAVSGKPSALTSTTFQSDVAGTLVGRLGEGIAGHSAKTALSVFDRGQVEFFTQVKEQIGDWFDQYRSFRVHYKITQWTPEGAIQVHFQIEQTPLPPDFPATRKDLNVVFYAHHGKDGWRIASYEPAELFLP